MNKLTKICKIRNWNLQTVHYWVKSIAITTGYDYESLLDALLYIVRIRLEPKKDIWLQIVDTYLVLGNLETLPLEILTLKRLAEKGII